MKNDVFCQNFPKTLICSIVLFLFIITFQLCEWYDVKWNVESTYMQLELLIEIAHTQEVACSLKY